MFFRQQIDYLCYTIDSIGISLISLKIKDILNPPHTDVKQVKSFLGLARFYRPFIKGFVKIALPLSKLLSTDAPFVKSDEQHAFDSLKMLLTRSPVLIFHDL